MVDKVLIPEMDDGITGLYALKDFVKSQQPIIEEKLVEKYAGVLEDYIKDHEDSIGGRLYSIEKKLSKYRKFSEPILKINLDKGNFNDYWAKLFNGVAKETIPKWADLFGDNINAVYNSLKEIGDINSAFLKNFDLNNAVAEAGISEELKEMENYLVDDEVYLKYKEDIPSALYKYNRNIQALVEYMDEVDISRESTEEAADAVKESIDKSNKFFKLLINGLDHRKTVLQGALLLRNSLNEIQKTVNVCLTDCDENIDFDGSSLRNIDTGSFIGILYKLENIDKDEQEFKERALESLGYEFENKTVLEFLMSDPRSGEGKIVSREFYKIAVRKKD